MGTPVITQRRPSGHILIGLMLHIMSRRVGRHNRERWLSEIKDARYDLALAVRALKGEEGITYAVVLQRAKTPILPQLNLLYSASDISEATRLRQAIHLLRAAIGERLKLVQ